MNRRELLTFPALFALPALAHAEFREPRVEEFSGEFSIGSMSFAASAALRLSSG